MTPPEGEPPGEGSDHGRLCPEPPEAHGTPRPDPGAPARLVVLVPVVAGVLLTQIIAQVILLHLLGLSSPEIAELARKPVVLPLMAAVPIPLYLLALGRFVAPTPARRERLFSLGGRRAAGLAVTLGVVGAAIGMMVALRYGRDDTPMAELLANPRALFMVALAGLVAPVAEELLYRGLLFETILAGMLLAGRGKGGEPEASRKRASLAAALVVTLLFAAVHYGQLAGDWASLGVIAVMGLFWSVLRAVTGSLALPMLSHFAYNATLVAPVLLAGAGG